MVDQPLRDVGANLQPAKVGTERPTQIMQRPWRNVGELVERLLALAPAAEGVLRADRLVQQVARSLLLVCVLRGWRMPQAPPETGVPGGSWSIRSQPFV